jgi:lysophospholipase L1-like esterase
MKVFFQNILLSLFSIFIFFVLGEIAFRVYYYSKGPRTVEMDEPLTLGWDVVHGQKIETTLTDFSKKTYQCGYSIEENGFRRFGKVDSDKKKILFLGDSFTQAEDATDDSTYYSVVAQNSDFEVFAYGVGGYGSMQELMLLKKYIAAIKPDLVVVQFTSNDFVNNSEALEFRSAQNNGTIRPYMSLSGELTYALPQKWPELRHFANKYSRFLYFILVTADKAFRKKELTFSETDYQQSYKITQRIYQQISDVCKENEAKVASFIVDPSQPEGKLYNQLMKELNIEVLADIPTLIQQTEQKGICCKAADGGHWNNKGHIVCGKALAQAISRTLM